MPLRIWPVTRTPILCITAPKKTASFLILANALTVDHSKITEYVAYQFHVLLKTDFVTKIGIKGRLLSTNGFILIHSTL